ncbi:MAG TPA: carboxylesterase family protein, partial [Kofleriaceae bacterium]
MVRAVAPVAALSRQPSQIRGLYAMMRCLFALAFIACHAASPRAIDPLVVDTDRGPVRGVQTALGREFLGIPFAAPPIGELRWRPPVQAVAWTEPRDATKRGHACLQLERGGLRKDSDEDCLNLEVWVPPGADHAPVMVWIPGGAFIEGGGNFPLYDGAKLAAREHVIVVAFNYRVGPLGFFALAQPGEPHMPSLGLLDQRAALQWVQRNIARFGGDPSNVTIFGESAGAWSVCAQMAMPNSRGLFARAIMQSGSCSDPLYFTAEAAEA